MRLPKRRRDPVHPENAHGVRSDGTYWTVWIHDPCGAKDIGSPTSPPDYCRCRPSSLEHAAADEWHPATAVEARAFIYKLEGGPPNSGWFRMLV